MKFLTQASAVGDPSSTLHMADKNYVDNGDGLLVPKSLFTTKGDLVVATASGTVARQGVGNNNDAVVADSSKTNGIRYDAARGFDLAYTREVAGVLCGTAWDIGLASVTWDFSASVRTCEFLLGKLAAGTVISNFKTYNNAGMTGGAATLALYESTSLTSTSWTRLGSNTTITTLMQSTGKVSIGYSATVGSSDAYIRAMIVLTSTPSAYPKFYGSWTIVDNAVGGHALCGASSATTSPGSTLDPSGFASPGESPMCVLT